MLSRRITMIILMNCLSASIVAYAGAVTAQPTPNRPQQFSWTIDASVVPFQGELPTSPRGPRPLAAVRDSGGIVSTFVVNELLAMPRKPADLSAILAFTRGVVVADDRVPAPPPGRNLRLSGELAAPTTFVVKVDPSSFTLASFSEDAPQYSGQTRMSSDLAARLLALSSRLQALGFAVSPNFVSQPHGAMLFSTQDGSLGPGFLNYLDAFTIAPYGAAGSKASVTQAWQFVAAHGIARRVNIAIIDGGFWLDTTGHPVTDSAGVSDLPDWPIQYDFIGDDYVADGENPSKCKDGTVCRWHGNNSAAVALGTINNHWGGAGTGGQVADPILLLTDLSDGQVKRAVRTARHWGADVISMSFGSNCNKWCRYGRGLTHYRNPFQEADAAGIVLVASAGNDNDDASAEYTMPCVISHICVGALTPNENSKIEYSNYGDDVNMWAPTNILTMPDGDTPAGPGAFGLFGGTSASAPFISGIAAMMKAMNPGLTGYQTGDILSSTSWKDSSDPKVTLYVNALLAVSKAAENRLSPDAFEFNDSPATASAVSPGSSYKNLSLHHAADQDHYKFKLEGYSKLDLRANYVRGLGNLQIDLVRDSAGGGGPEGVTVKTALPNVRSYHADVVGPGIYRWFIRGNAPNIYDFGFSRELITLPPDMFEPDNTLSSPARPDLGEYRVNHHLVDDRDFYAFKVTPSTTSRLVVTVDADWPVQVILYDPAGEIHEMDSTTVSPPLKSSGEWKVEVRGTREGRYTFGAYYTLHPLLLGRYSPLFKRPPRQIKPGDPPALGLIGDEDRFLVFQMGPGVATAALTSKDAHLSLVNLAGHRLAEGQRSGEAEEEVSLEQLVAGEYYILKVASPRRASGEAANIASFAVRLQSRGGRDRMLPLVSEAIHVDD